MSVDLGSLEKALIDSSFRLLVIRNKSTYAVNMGWEGNTQHMGCEGNTHVKNLW